MFDPATLRFDANGLIPAIAGEVRLAGRPIGALSRAEIAAHLAYVPQSLATPFPYTALDIVTMGASTAVTDSTAVSM